MLLSAASRPAPDFAALAAADLRVATTAWRLQRANVALCRDVVPLSGLVVQSLDQYARRDRAQAAAVLRLSDRPGVTGVVPGSAADRAGITAGEALMTIDGEAVPRVRDGGATDEGAAQVQTMLDAALSRPPAEIEVLDTGKVRHVALTGDPGCASRIELVTAGSPNGRADGRLVQITAALYDLVESDDELAAVIAHELAHNILGHRTRLDAQGVSRGVFAGLGRNGARLRETEFEADALSVWLIARAGYDLDAVTLLWTRLAERLGRGIFSDGTHPAWRERIARIVATVAKVKAERAAGRPLVPPSQPAFRR